MNELFSNFKECMTTKFATFSGRARRREFWLFALFTWIVSCVLQLLSIAVQDSVVINALVAIVSLLFLLFILIPGLALDVRRLHDTGRSGWWLLIALLPIIGAIVLLVFFCTAGTAGENEYGADPKATGDGEVKING